MSGFSAKIGDEKQFATTYEPPRTMNRYNELLRQYSSKEDGWLELRIGHSNRWERKWVIFEQSSLQFGPEESASRDKFQIIPMDSVVSIRTEDKLRDLTITVKTLEQSFQFRAPSLSDAQRWVFCFQKSVALVLSHLMKYSNSRSGRTLSTGREDSGWTLETGNKHGEPMLLAKRRASMNAQGLDHLEEELHSPNSKLRGRSRSNDGGLIDDENDDFFHDGNSADAGDEAANWGTFSAPTLGSNSKNNNNSSSNSNKPSSGIGSGLMGGSNMLNSKTPNRAVGLAVPKLKIGSMQSTSMAIPIVNSGRKDSTDDTQLAGSYSPQSFNDKILSTICLTDRANSFHQQRDRASSEESNSSGGGGTGDWVDVPSDDEGGSMQFAFDDVVVKPKPATGLSSPAGSSNDGSDAAGNNGNTQVQRRRSGLGQMLDKNSVLSALSGNNLANLDGSIGGGSGVGSLPKVGGLSAALSAMKVARELRWECGAVSKLGPRSSNEDTYVVIPDIFALGYGVPLAAPIGGSVNHYPGSNKQAYFAVYDGHCGGDASSYLQNELHKSLFQHPSFPQHLELAITETCQGMDRAVLEMCRAKRSACGTTALGAYIRDSQLTVFNIGDCHAVLSCAGAPIDMSVAHKPNRPDEAQRVKDVNGWITEEREMYMGRLHHMDLSDPDIYNEAKDLNWVDIYRVCGELAVSRSIGDKDYKGFVKGQEITEFYLWPENHDHTFHGDVVIPDPEFKVRQLTPNDEFLIIASDGLWDVVKPIQAIEHVRKIFSQGKNPTEAAEFLSEQALRLGSTDNVTVLVIRFHYS